ncbi:uncharacterized protein MYCFIDRAFT_172256 [Pseudocercospora fijiensis CIRAD86]|uniref:Uncharacterized protein n=1 Tax=Pseudocercospora fijiensis (strain CIRAD86) TaxID=383855 RepID=M3APH9_PSEFD|nr:uncharacterized protein MYCFIDRAFT_172256 [Pseudocercospora fijiensis CIRAD86]EME86521.1 hypothetical protein MYCFIDRAFT_172256 [Pseudocercospora fijiensis CIRAD86]
MQRRRSISSKNSVEKLCIAPADCSHAVATMTFRSGKHDRSNSRKNVHHESSPSTMVMADTDSLARLMQSLPQEIFDKIYRQVFDLPRWTGLKEAAEIPFTLLHVDYSSREEVAAAFYSTASIIHYLGTHKSYLDFIPRHHRFLVPEVFCAYNHFNCTKYDIDHRSMSPAYMPHGAIMSSWLPSIIPCPPSIADGFAQLKCYYADSKTCNLVEGATAAGGFVGAGKRLGLMATLDDSGRCAQSRDWGRGIEATEWDLSLHCTALLVRTPFSPHGTSSEIGRVVESGRVAKLDYWISTAVLLRNRYLEESIIRPKAQIKGRQMSPERQCYGYALGQTTGASQNSGAVLLTLIVVLYKVFHMSLLQNLCFSRVSTTSSQLT